VEGLVQRARVSYVCLSRETALRESLSEQEYVLCFLVVVKLKRSFIASERVCDCSHYFISSIIKNWGLLSRCRYSCI
jgi:hypothetical protein